MVCVCLFQSKTHNSSTQTSDEHIIPPLPVEMRDGRGPYPNPRGGSLPDPLPRQSTAPSLLAPTEPHRSRLSATSVAPDFEQSRRCSRGSHGNTALINAVVEVDPAENGLGRPPWAHEAQDSLDHDADDQSDYDNQPASDMEVNLESEADVAGLDASGDEVGEGAGSGGADPEIISSDSTDTDSSSGEEEQALFHRLQTNPRVKTPQEQPETDFANLTPTWPLHAGNHGTGSPWQPHYKHHEPRQWDNHAAFANRYALDNSRFGDRHFQPPPPPVSSRTPLPQGAADLDQYPYDPDPDATVI